MRGRGHRVHRAQDRHRRHRRDDQPGQRDRVPQLRRPLRPHRSGVRGLRQLERRPGAGRRARLGHHLPGRLARHHGSRRGVRHLRLLHRDRVRRHQPRPRPRRAPSPRSRSRRPARTTRRRPTTTPSSPASRAPRPASAGSASPSPSRPVTSVTEIPIAAEPGGECVAPTAETIADNTYPISRNLYIYVNAAMAEENEAVVVLRRLLPLRRGHRVGGGGRVRRARPRGARGHPDRLGGPGDRHPRRRLILPMA